MGSRSTSSPTALPCNISNSCGGLNNNGTNNFSSSLFGAGLNKHSSINEVMQQCNLIGSVALWFGIKVFVLITSLPANAGLFWLLMSCKTALSAFEVLSLNLSILDVFYCVCLPVDIYTAHHYNVSQQMFSAGDALSTLNLFSCPVLLTCMCLERFLAAAFPAVNMLGKPKNRGAVCGLVWILTLVVMLLGYYQGVLSMALFLALNVSVYFLITLLCLVGIMLVLCGSEPGECVEQKKTALKNILSLLVPSLVVYSPLVALPSFLSTWQPEKQNLDVNRMQCLILQLLLVLPNFSLLIGPLFYMSRLRKLLPCGRKGDEDEPAD
ncbi:hypothetical protein DPEC_G00163410 [Dallia pectoralis]|uniref:Uncharacterized protein n=1 Tax=Dallia pectoralis TaxID=75939 RepID=A0ACC2GGR7_DALPE|nr:hypothetical protein DPEC_G00163410 [Dallia pectoralis]